MAFVGASSGCLSLALWFCTLVLQLHQHRSSRKETATASPSLRAPDSITNSRLQIAVYNSGRVPIFVKRVELGWRHDGNIYRVPLGVPAVHKTLTGHEILQNTNRISTKTELPVGAEQVYVLFDIDAAQIALLSRLSTRRIWLSVTTPAGEVCRVRGRRLKNLLLELSRRLASEGTRSSASVVQDVEVTVANWNLRFMHRDAMGGISRGRIQIAEYATFSFDADITNRRSEGMVCKEWKASFVQKGQAILIEASQQDNGVGHFAFMRMEEIRYLNLPGQEGITVRMSGGVAKADLPKLLLCDSVRLDAFSPEGEKYEWTIQQLDFSLPEYQNP